MLFRAETGKVRWGLLFGVLGLSLLGGYVGMFTYNSIKEQQPRGAVSGAPASPAVVAVAPPSSPVAVPSSSSTSEKQNVELRYGNDRAIRETRDQYGRKVSEATPDVEFQYIWEGATNRCSGATATSHGVLIGTAAAVGIGGDDGSGHYVEVKELQYALGGTNEVVYKGLLRFKIGPRGRKVLDAPLSGAKRYALFETWPMGGSF